MDAYLYETKPGLWRGPIQAEVVDVAPHLKATFILHRDPWRTEETWKISEATTGTCVIGELQYLDREEAIAIAEYKLKGITQGRLDAAIEKARATQQPRTESNTAPLLLAELPREGGGQRRPDDIST